MTFHSDLVTDAVWPADIRAALSLSDPASVYVGRRTRQVSQGAIEVRLERRAVTPEGAGSFDELRSHSYGVEVRARNLSGGNLAGQEQVISVDAALRTLRDRYGGTRPATILAGTTGLVTMTATEEAVDVDPDDERYMLGTLAVSFLVNT